MTCSPHCLNCRGGKATYHVQNEDGKCPFCSGIPNPFPSHYTAITSKISEARALLKTLRNQHYTQDPMRGFTLDRLRANLAAIEAIESGQKTTETPVEVPDGE